MDSSFIDAIIGQWLQLRRDPTEVKTSAKSGGMPDFTAIRIAGPNH